MNVLAIDASTRMLSVCLAMDSGRTESLLDVGLTHAERIIDLVDFCVTRANVEKSAIELVACAEGPGSFTGLRIGMATAKGIAAALGIPWVAVPTLDCLAWGLENTRGAVVPVIDARKGRYWAALYLSGERQGDWLDISAEGLAALMDRHEEVLVTGPNAGDFEALATERSGITMDPRAGTGAARGLAALALEAFGQRGGYPDSAGPLYLRPSEAEETALAAGRGAKA